MPITDMLAHNAYVRGNETALVEVNPAIRDDRGISWREFELVETNPANRYRRQISWRFFNEQANRFAHMLMNEGVGRGDKVAILLMNCLEWLPIYFGILKSGAIAVPLNFRYTFGLGKIAAVYAATGPQFGFNVGSTEWKHVFDGGDTTFKRENMNVSWNIGAGVKLLKHLEIGLSYNIAITKYAKVLSIVGSEAEEFAKSPKDYNFKTNTFQIQAAYLF